MLDFNRSIISLSTNLQPYAINLTKDMDGAKDLLQETMLRALANREKFKEGTNLKAWLFTIMKNIFINKYRKKVKRNTLIDTTDNHYYINSAGNATNNRAEGNFVLDDLNYAIDGLSADYKVPFMMFYTGYKYHEIAAHLKLPLGTVKSRIFFARKALKKQLQPYAQPVR